MDDRLFAVPRTDQDSPAAAAADNTSDNESRPTAAYGRCHITGCLCTMFTGGWSTCQTSGCGHHFDSHH